MAGMGRGDQWKTRGENIVMLGLCVPAIVLLAVFVIGMSDRETTKSVLKNQGFTDIAIKGWTFFGCGRGDFYRTKFYAHSSTDSPTKGVVCCGLLKGCTIRYDH